MRGREIVVQAGVQDLYIIGIEVFCKGLVY